MIINPECYSMFMAGRGSTYDTHLHPVYYKTYIGTLSTGIFFNTMTMTKT